MYTLVLFLIFLFYFSDSLSIMSLWLFWNSLHGQDWPWIQRDLPVLLPKYWDWSWFQKKYVSFSLFSIVLPADLSCTDFTMLRFVPSLSSLFSVWFMEGWSFSNAFMHLYIFLCALGNTISGQLPTLHAVRIYLPNHNPSYYYVSSGLLLAPHGHVFYGSANAWWLSFLLPFYSMVSFSCLFSPPGALSPSPSPYPTLSGALSANEN